MRGGGKGNGGACTSTNRLDGGEGRTEEAARHGVDGRFQIQYKSVSERDRRKCVACIQTEYKRRSFLLYYIIRYPARSLGQSTLLRRRTRHHPPVFLSNRRQFLSLSYTIYLWVPLYPNPPWPCLFTKTNEAPQPKVPTQTKKDSKNAPPPSPPAAKTPTTHARTPNYNSSLPKKKPPGKEKKVHYESGVVVAIIAGVLVIIRGCRPEFDGRCVVSKGVVRKRRRAAALCMQMRRVHARE